MTNKKISRSDYMPNFVKEAISDVLSVIKKLPTKQFNKEASKNTKDTFVTKMKLDEASNFIKSCKSHGMGIYESPKGSIWKITKDANGEAWLEIDDDLSFENLISKDIINKSNKKKI